MVRPVEVSCLRPSGCRSGIPVGRTTCAASAGSKPVVWARGSPRLATSLRVLRALRPGSRFHGPKQARSWLADFRAPGFRMIWWSREPRQAWRWIGNVRPRRSRASGCSLARTCDVRNAEDKTRRGCDPDAGASGPDVCDPSQHLSRPRDHQISRRPGGRLSARQDDRFWPVESGARPKLPEHLRATLQDAEIREPKRRGFDPADAAQVVRLTGIPDLHPLGRGSRPPQVAPSGASERPTDAPHTRRSARKQ